MLRSRGLFWIDSRAQSKASVTTDARITRVSSNSKKLFVHPLRPFPQNDTTILDTFFTEEVLSSTKHQRMAVLSFISPIKLQNILLHTRAVRALPFKSFFDSQAFLETHFQIATNSIAAHRFDNFVGLVATLFYCQRKPNPDLYSRSTEARTNQSKGTNK